MTRALSNVVGYRSVGMIAAGDSHSIEVIARAGGGHPASADSIVAGPRQLQIRDIHYITQILLR